MGPYQLLWRLQLECLGQAKPKNVRSWNFGFGLLGLFELLGVLGVGFWCSNCVLCFWNSTTRDVNPRRELKASNSFAVEPALLSVPTTDRIDVRFTPKMLGFGVWQNFGRIENSIPYIDRAYCIVCNYILYLSIYLYQLYHIDKQI